MPSPSASQPLPMTPSQSLSIASSQRSAPEGSQTQACVSGSHVGDSGPQCASVRHSTHALGSAAVSQ